MRVAVEDSLNQSMDEVVKRYSSLFRLPSYRKMLLLLALSCLGAGVISAITLFPPFEALVNGLSLGFSLFIVNLIFDYVVSMLILGQDPIFDLRRSAALSLFCWELWLLFIVVGVAIGVPVRLYLLGFSAVCSSFFQRL